MARKNKEELENKEVIGDELEEEEIEVLPKWAKTITDGMSDTMELLQNKRESEEPPENPEIVKVPVPPVPEEPEEPEEQPPRESMGKRFLKFLL